MKNYVLMTAKGGNATLKNKNLIPIKGKPSMYWGINAGKQSGLVEEIFLTTEDKSIAEVGRSLGCVIIDRPIELAQQFSNHGDVILHALKEMMSEHDVKSDDCVTILLGNTVMVTTSDIDMCFSLLSETPEADSVMTVWKAQDDHPYRALSINERGFLETYGGFAADTNRQSYPDVFFYDQGPWTVRVSAVLKSEENRLGPGPWWWMGENSLPLERLWVTGRDTHCQFDVEIAEWWLEAFPLKSRPNPRSVEDS